MLTAIREWFSDVKAAVRARLDKLPDLDEILREREIHARAMAALGDRVSAWEPGSIDATLRYISIAARAAQFASGGKLKGAEKADLVIARVRKAWAKLSVVDQHFDDFWADVGRPYLNAYADTAKAQGAWVPPA